MADPKTDAAAADPKAAPNTDSKTGAEKPQADAAAKAAANAQAAAAQDKPADKAAAAVKEGDKPTQDASTLLDEAGKEPELDKDGKPIVKSETPTGAPEKYEAFKLPEGFMMDETTLKAAEPIFRELNLNQQAAQKLVDLQTNIVKASEDAHVAEFENYVESLKKESKEFFGPKLKEVMVNVARVRDQFIDKPLQDKLNISGLSNDKDVLVFLDKIGRTIGEGKFIEGKPGGGGGPQAGQEVSLKEIYPSMANK